MSDWINVVCTACGWEQQYPQSGSLFAFKCDKCSAGSYKWAETQAADEEEKIVVKEPADEGFMCQVECKRCRADHLWSQAALNNRGFVCDWQDCGCTDYRLMGIDQPWKPSETPVGLRSTASIDHPEHYTAHPSGVECITITEHFNFNLGNAIKYIWRAGLKGRQREDLQKAAWYITRELQRIADKKDTP